MDAVVVRRRQQLAVRRKGHVAYETGRVLPALDDLGRLRLAHFEFCGHRLTVGWDVNYAHGHFAAVLRKGQVADILFEMMERLASSHVKNIRMIVAANRHVLAVGTKAHGMQIDVRTLGYELRKGQG